MTTESAETTTKSSEWHRSNQNASELVKVENGSTNPDAQYKYGVLSSATGSSAYTNLKANRTISVNTLRSNANVTMPLVTKSDCHTELKKTETSSQ